MLIDNDNAGVIENVSEKPNTLVRYFDSSTKKTYNERRSSN